MTDRYVYYFTGLAGSAGANTMSARPATLEALKGVGEPVMDSQLVVDDTELDRNGFLILGLRDQSPTPDDLTAQINSFELRAASRDREALELNDGADDKEKYMLSLESRELRSQARSLINQRTAATTAELRDMHDAQDCGQLEGSPTTG
jgi:hypothetical protein